MRGSVRARQLLFGGDHDEQIDSRRAGGDRVRVGGRGAGRPDDHRGRVEGEGADRPIPIHYPADNRVVDIAELNRATADAGTN